MTRSGFILFAIITLSIFQNESRAQNFSVEFYEDTFNFKAPASFHVSYINPLSEQSVKSFYTQINSGDYQPVLDSLLSYKKRHQLNDWLYYQLIRQTAQRLSPKANDYLRYTLYKWFLLSKSGYDARLVIANDELLFYVRSDENIYDIPFYLDEGKQYVCLNYHDYAKIDFEKNKLFPIRLDVPEAKNAFSYKVTRMPDFQPAAYEEKNLGFNYHQKEYHFKIKLNPEVETIFANYPGVDFEYYFNIPLSKETYSSLIPLLKKNISGMNQKKGVDYLMHFTRYAFLYEDDEENFGKEKRLSPEQTLFYDHSDCDDRAALFFCLVKEIYNLPMIALLYPTHITMAVEFDKPAGETISYKGKKYSVCEPTPQQQDLRIGQLSARYLHVPYQVVYQYEPFRSNSYK